MGKFIDLTGRVFGRWTVIRRAENYGTQARWVCTCSCGTDALRTTGALSGGESSSCGCYRKEKMSTQKGLSSSKEYNSWKSIVARCTHVQCKDYPRYGGAGVTICADWLNSFDAFISYVGPKPTPKHSIDRIDNAKGYEHGNVRWATGREQQANRKNTTFIEYLGVRQPLAALAHAHGLAPKVVNSRVFRYGWTVEKALTTPVT
jgi:hypothetical protein